MKPLLCLWLVLCACLSPSATFTVKHGDDCGPTILQALQWSQANEGIDPADVYFEDRYPVLKSPVSFDYAGRVWIRFHVAQFIVYTGPSGTVGLSLGGIRGSEIERLRMGASVDGTTLFAFAGKPGSCSGNRLVSPYFTTNQNKGVTFLQIGSALGGDYSSNSVESPKLVRPYGASTPHDTLKAVLDNGCTGIRMLGGDTRANVVSNLQASGLNTIIDETRGGGASLIQGGTASWFGTFWRGDGGYSVTLTGLRLERFLVWCQHGAIDAAGSVDGLVTATGLECASPYTQWQREFGLGVDGYAAYFASSRPPSLSVRYYLWNGTGEKVPATPYLQRSALRPN
jgi:hypothetical protein